MTPRLSQATLPALAHRVEVPGYMRDRVRSGIVHLGLGGFHRAHMARYTHDLMERSDESAGWGIVGVGLRASDGPLITALAEQDCLYTCQRRPDLRVDRAA